MMIQNLPEKYRKDLLGMVLCDRNNVHLFWSCPENELYVLSDCSIPAGNIDPLDYIAEHNMVSESHTELFKAFSADVHESIKDGTERSRLAIDISIDLGSGPAMHHFTAIYLRDDKKRVSRIHFIIIPFSEKEKSDRLILDTFTADQNPRIYGQRVRMMMNRFPDSNIAFIQFDVERFKLINEKYGVERGDEILKFFKDTLTALCTDDQPFTRLNADVFTIATVFNTEQDIIDYIRWLESKLLGYKGMEYRLIFGVAIVEDRTLHTRRHSDNATLARQSVKGNAMRNIAFFNGSMKSELHHRQNIEDEMEKALSAGEFKMFLQPKYSISTGRIIGAEALTRWIHPERGMIPPNEFIPIFEKNGFILKLDVYIWECACRKIREWIDNGIEPVPISVNVSREYLKTFDVVGKFMELVDVYKIPVSLLEAEITESLDSEYASQIVRNMKEHGFTMLMDDFGSGYSSLNMLKTTPFDVLKIDRNFLNEFIESDRGRKIIAHTISMSQDIGLDIVAEGVETREQANFLSVCGCDSAQGFLYSRPVTADEFDEQMLAVNGGEKNESGK